MLGVGLATLMGLTLLVLAVLQYRWIGEVGEAERARLHAGLNNAVQQLRTEFNAELRRMCLAFELEPEALAARNWDRLIERYDYWLSEERHVKLIEDVFLLTSRSNGEKELQWLDAQAGQWLPSEWPARLERMGKQLDGRFARRAAGPGAGRFSLWWVLAEDFILVQPLAAREGASAPPEISGFLVLVLNQQYFQNVFLPEMAQRYFNDRPEADFEAAVVLTGRGRMLLCCSDLHPDARLLDKPDIRVRLLWDRPDLAPVGAGAPPPLGRLAFGGRNRDAPLFLGSEAGEWEVVADYRGGSLDEIVSRSRRRSLAVSFGVLLLLGAGMTLIILGARRSNQLAELQMKFVAGVSHDLRTPLAVICSAADNLAAGVVDDSAGRVREYGSLIRSEGRKLSAMVEQILRYASLKSASRKPEPQPVAIVELVNAVLADEKPSIDLLGFQVETEIPADLPAAWGDRAALQQALRNLVSNAIKYGAPGRWMCIRAARIPDSGNETVSISVEDRGPGIEPEDLPHVFEPFYRGRTATASATPGSGLGLSVVEQSVSAMGGRTVVRSAPGGGTTFTLYLPSASRAAEASQGKG